MTPAEKKTIETLKTDLRAKSARLEELRAEVEGTHTADVRAELLRARAGLAQAQQAALVAPSPSATKAVSEARASLAAATAAMAYLEELLPLRREAIAVLERAVEKAVRDIRALENAAALRRLDARLAERGEAAEQVIRQFGAELFLRAMLTSHDGSLIPDQYPGPGAALERVLCAEYYPAGTLADIRVPVGRKALALRAQLLEEED